ITGTGTDRPLGNGLYADIVEFGYYLPWLVGTEPPAPDDPMTPRYADFSDSKVVGARVLFIGPIGARADFFDLASRAMKFKTDVRKPSDVTNGKPNIDSNDDGLPDYNYGIGHINLTGTNASSVLVIGGIEIDQPSAGVTNPFADLASRSSYDDFEM